MAFKCEKCDGEVKGFVKLLSNAQVKSTSLGPDELIFGADPKVAHVGCVKETSANKVDKLQSELDKTTDALDKALAEVKELKANAKKEAKKTSTKKTSSKKSAKKDTEEAKN